MSRASDSIYEQVLVVRCKAGDEHAFAELVNLYGPRLHYYIRKLLHDDDRALDVLQEVWFDVYRSLPRLADAGALAGWLYRIARDRAYRELRKKRPEPVSLDETADRPANADEPDFTVEDAGQIHAALDQLPPEQREVLVLRFLEELSYEEVATVTGCLVGTVRSRLHYAKRALRRALERTQDHE
jgi:RNA polymerase sigma-70 factor, ECF subfamily